MVRRLVTTFASIILFATPAFAQQPEAAPVASTRCGGVLCDFYYAGKPAPSPGQPDLPDPTHLPCRDFLCAAFGGRTAEPTPVPEQAVPQPVAAPAKIVKRRRKASKTVASADLPKAEPAKADPAK